MFIHYECKETYIPSSYEEIKEIIEVAKKKKLKVHPIGMGRNHVGKKVSSEICISLSKLNKIMEVSKSDLYVTAQAGIEVQYLNSVLSFQNLFLPFYYPGSLGGLASTNMPSVFSLIYPYPRDLILGAKILLGDGSIIRSGSRTTKFSSGYKLWKALSGSLGSLGIYLELTFRLIPKPERIVYTEVSSPLQFLQLRPFGIISQKQQGVQHNYLILAGFESYLQKISQENSFLLNDGLPNLDLQCGKVYGISVPRGTEIEILKKFDDGIAYVGGGYVRVCDQSALDLRKQGYAVVIEKGCEDNEYCFGFSYLTFKMLKNALDPDNIFPMVL